jgi:hypothetical protein
LVAIHVLFVNLTVAANICHLDVQDGILLLHDVILDVRCACNVSLCPGVYIAPAFHLFVPPLPAVHHQLNVFPAFSGASGNVTSG